MLEIEITGTNQNLEATNKLQGTQEWLNGRLGFFTGSEIEDLMKCSAKTSKKDWNDLDKVSDFSDTAIKYIYKVGQSRLTKLHEMNLSSKAMSHGSENEILLRNDLGIDEVGFKKHEDLTLWLGSSSDGFELPSLKFPKGRNIEIKSPVSWNGVYERVEEFFDYKHNDFWQIQTEMLVLGVDHTRYIVTDVCTHESYTDLELESSPIHQKRLIQRLRIANRAIDIFAANGRRGIHEAVKLATAEFFECV